MNLRGVINLFVMSRQVLLRKLDSQVRRQNLLIKLVFFLSGKLQLMLPFLFSSLVPAASRGSV